ncbi:MAG: ATP-dependent DNA helicase RecG, partial [Boseongicola sp.]|nr:ATP-dependent DNA helicase RecG [Boseongicola sp.]
MSGRPEILFPLFSSVETLSGIGPKTAKLLVNLEVENARDLILTLPHSGINRKQIDTVDGVVPPQVVTVAVEVQRHHPARGKGRPHRVDVSDAKTSFQLVFFHARADWLAKQLPEGERRIISGKLEAFDNTLQMPHPDYIVTEARASDIRPYEPVYPLTAGLTAKTMTKAMSDALTRIPHLEEWIDPVLIEQEGWPAWDRAVSDAHAPGADNDLLSMAPARQRLAYDEFFAHQLTLALARRNRKRRSGRPSKATGRLQSPVMAALPYTPTNAQQRAIEEIQSDMANAHRMNRLLQGDVGSGKTLVALMALLTAVEAGGQGVMMAPTEILAQQHYHSLRALCEPARVVVEVLTGRDRAAERRAKLKALENGDIGILVGTHAVFQDDVNFADLRLAVIDEQHRFGVSQRMRLGEKGKAADVLVMTATPIPRSLSLAQYGDLDVSILDEKPAGRKPVKTALISTSRFDEVLEHLKSALAEGRQAYWVCPLVDESETSDLAAAEDRFRKLRSAFGEGNVGLVHGQMPVPDKDEAMARFASGETQVLVATTVIEVGVDVPNASIMVIERAESFGLSQLHQLRGRVGRGSDASTCLLMFQQPLSEGARRRLEIMRETEDGFRIAEEDLAMRGAGDVLGTAQSGLPRFRVADVETQAGLMATAQKDARRLIDQDPGLSSARGNAARHLLWLLS